MSIRNVFEIFEKLPKDPSKHIINKYLPKMQYLRTELEGAIYTKFGAQARYFFLARVALRLQIFLGLLNIKDPYELIFHCSSHLDQVHPVDCLNIN